MRVLIIEDDPDLLSGLAQALREDGYAVDEASDGVDGLYKAQTWPYDAIVLDRMLPGLDGMELLRKLRAGNRVPVLILSAKDTINDRVDGLDHGADDYLVKPFDLRELLSRLRALIRRKHHLPNPIIQIGNLTIDTNARTVHDGVRVVELINREYRLLEFLATRRGQLVSRTMIYECLFDESHDSLSNLVDVYVSRLRSKLGKGLITTRRGEGYMIPPASEN